MWILSTDKEEEVRNKNITYKKQIYLIKFQENIDYEPDYNCGLSFKRKKHAEKYIKALDDNRYFFERITLL